VSEASKLYQKKYCRYVACYTMFTLALRKKYGKNNRFIYDKRCFFRFFPVTLPACSFLNKFQNVHAGKVTHINSRA